MPRRLRRYVMHFEAAIEDAVSGFAASIPAGARVLDAGAGEGNYREYFTTQRYTSAWIWASVMRRGTIRGSMWLAILTALPFAPATFDASLNVVTLEHVREPARVLTQIACALAPGGRFLLIAPHEWEEHQQPHDYFRYTRYGLDYLLRQAGFAGIEIRPVGGFFFRSLSRRLFNALQFFPGPLMPLAAIFFVPPALLLPLLDPLDRRQNFTLGYICFARKPS